MTKKEFVLFEHKDNHYILKNPRMYLDFIEMLGDALTFEEIVNELNRLSEENKKLKNEIENAHKVIELYYAMVELYK